MVVAHTPASFFTAQTCCTGGVGNTSSTRASRLSQAALAATASHLPGGSPSRGLSRPGAAATAANDGMNSGRQSLVGEEGVSLFVRDSRMSGMGRPASTAAMLMEQQARPAQGSHSGAASGGIGSQGGRGQSTSRPSSAGTTGPRPSSAGTAGEPLDW
jgi:hypothetical protein